jgi:small subunit ribosomal protein S3
LGQKVNPIGFRLGVNKTWDAKWFSKKNVPDLIQEDIKMRDFVKKKLFLAGVGRIVIERAGKSIRVNIHAARPGFVIGKKGADIEALKTSLEQFTDAKVNINILPIRKPELNAQIVAEDIAQQLLKRGSFRRILKKSITRAMTSGAQGIKVRISGRLGGAEIARSEWQKEGRIPLQTLRANIDYGFAESLTTYGKIGVKVWIFIEEAIEEKALPVEKEAAVIAGEVQEPRCIGAVEKVQEAVVNASPSEEKLVEPAVSIDAIDADESLIEEDEKVD